MQSAMSLSLSSSSSPITVRSNTGSTSSSPNVFSSQLRFCGLRREAFTGTRSLSSNNNNNNNNTKNAVMFKRLCPKTKVTASLNGNGAQSKGFDYDLVIIGAGVGGHGAALHAVEKGLKTAIIEGDVVGGTCVNRGCVPSKALLAVSGRMRELQNEHHMKSFGLQVAAAGYDRQGVADHAENLATKIRNNLTNSLKSLGVDILTGVGTVVGQQKVKYGKAGGSETVITAKDIIIATGSVPFVPKGVEVDGKTVITSDHALKLETVPEWIVIVGSGYIGLEFSDVYTALGSEVTFVEALDQLMPGFDPEIGKLAQRVLINPRKIDYHTGVFATKITPAKDGKPVTIELIDAKTKEPKDTLEVNVETQRGFIPVDERMRVIDSKGKLPQAREKAEKEGFEISIAKTSFKANTKALAENEGEGMAKLIYRPDNGEILGVHIFGMHAADLIHEASNAIALGTRIQDIKYAVHAHPTLSEVIDELFKSAKVKNEASRAVGEPVAV
ncbi:hypothetical protein M8C21_010848 [Ambrosia artemisiifolia]|uniref:dihydrolipoyl dehydrogenase n=1 Tax=Ambrosia artemisiifolia TaxID=4212 RepID=A0AAD5C6F7_AMBAR|nr:hypothetical protein M8C21_010848 [Ambrosia artemisiifolia]